MKQTKKLTYRQRRILLAYDNKIKDTSDFRVVEDKKNVLILTDPKGRIVEIGKS